MVTYGDLAVSLAQRLVVLATYGDLAVSLAQRFVVLATYGDLAVSLAQRFVILAPVDADVRQTAGGRAAQRHPSTFQR